MLGALIGGVGSVLGGIFGSRPQKGKSKSKSWTNSTSTTRNRVRLGQMVRQAEKNGFNPLTLLRSGGLAAFTNTTTSGSSFTKSKTKGTQSSSAPLGAGIAGAASIIGGAIDSGPSQESIHARDAWAGLRGNDATYSPRAEMNLVNQQLAGVNYGTLDTQPRQRVSSTYRADKPALAAAAGSDGSSLTPTYEQPTVTNPFPKGWGVKVNPNMPDAAAWEERYGGSELAEMAFAIGVGASDIYHNLPDYSAERQKAYDNEAANNEALSQLKVRPFQEDQMSLIMPNFQSSNVWDPPAIAVADRPVVTHHTYPAMGGNKQGFNPRYDGKW